MKKIIKSTLVLLLCVCMLLPNVSLVSAASLGQVKKLKSTASTATTITLGWNKVSGAKSYEVYRYNSSSKSWTKLTTTSKTSYKVASLSTATSYKFKVRATNGSTKGKYSSQLTAATKPDKVKNLKISSVTKTSLKLSWSSVKRAAGYQVYAYNNSTHKWTKIKTTTAKSYTVKNLTAGTYCSYKVRAYFNFNDSKVCGSYSSTVSTITNLNKVTGLKAQSVTTSGYTLKWDKVAGAEKYYVYKLNGDSWKYLKAVDDTQYAIKDSSNKKVTYRVRAVAFLGDNKYYGAYSDSLTVQSLKDTPVVTKPKTPENLTATANTVAGNIKITWDAVEGATGYQLYRYDASNGQWTRITTTGMTSYTYGVSDTSTYTFKVRSYTQSGSDKIYSDFSHQVDVYYKSETGSDNETISDLEKSGILGYLYDPVNKCFYTAADPWQRNFGFTPLYDACAPFTIMFYNTVRLKFTYDNLDWMIQIWKGQYGWVFIGAEIGVYTKEPDFNVAGFYACASDDNLLNMSMVIYLNDKVIINRPYGSYWWCTGFVPGMLPTTIASVATGNINTDSLTMVARITLKNSNMAALFAKALEENGFVYGSSYIKSGADIIFTWR